METNIYSGGNTSTFADPGLSPDSSYTYVITTTSANGFSTGSATASTGLSVPGAIAAGNGPSEIDLTLSPDSNATSMQILRDGTQVYSGALVTTFADTHLTADATIPIPSSPAIRPTPSGYATGSNRALAPTIAAAANSNGTQIDLALGANSTANSMQIERDGTDIYNGAVTTSFSDIGLSPDSTHSYTVTTANGNGSSRLDQRRHRSRRRPTYLPTGLARRRNRHRHRVRRRRHIHADLLRRHANLLRRRRHQFFRYRTIP